MTEAVSDGWARLTPFQRIERKAPDGMVWQCPMCGKKAEDRYGEIGNNAYWWDESCAMHAVLVPAASLPQPQKDDRG